MSAEAVNNKSKFLWEHLSLVIVSMRQVRFGHSLCESGGFLSTVPPAKILQER